MNHTDGLEKDSAASRYSRSESCEVDDEFDVNGMDDKRYATNELDDDRRVDGNVPVETKANENHHTADRGPTVESKSGL